MSVRQPTTSVLQSNQAVFTRNEPQIYRYGPLQFGQKIGSNQNNYSLDVPEFFLLVIVDFRFLTACET